MGFSEKFGGSVSILGYCFLRLRRSPPRKSRYFVMAWVNVQVAAQQLVEYRNRSLPSYHAPDRYTIGCGLAADDRQ